jgi:hypothetical protein
MTILKQNDKAITNLGGEILTKAPVFDISDQYEIIKDVSNIVSKTKNGALPIFIPAKGANIIENGDGFDMTNGGTFVSPFNVDLQDKDFNFYTEFKLFGLVSFGNRLLFIMRYGANDNTTFGTRIEITGDGNIDVNIDNSNSLLRFNSSGAEAARLIDGNRYFISVKKRGNDYYYEDSFFKAVRTKSYTPRALSNSQITIGTFSASFPSFGINGHIYKSQFTIL